MCFRPEAQATEEDEVRQTGDQPNKMYGATLTLISDGVALLTGGSVQVRLLFVV